MGRGLGWAEEWWITLVIHPAVIKMAREWVGINEPQSFPELAVTTQNNTTNTHTDTTMSSDASESPFFKKQRSEGNIVVKGTIILPETLSEAG